MQGSRPICEFARNVAGLPGSEDYVVCPAMDARRNQVYTAAFQWEEGEVHRLMEDKAIPIPELLEALEAFGLPVLFVGDGASLCYTAAAETTLDATLAPEQLRYQNAVAVAACAAAKLEAGESPVGSDDILPVYLRAPQAERELKKRKSRCTSSRHSATKRPKREMKFFGVSTSMSLPLFMIATRSQSSSASSI